jgi:hypothetical protein
VILGGLMLIPALAARRATKPLKVAVLDSSGVLREPVEQALAGITEAASRAS